MTPVLSLIDFRTKSYKMLFPDEDESLLNQIWTVSGLNGYIKELFDIDAHLRDVEIEGEISNFTRARSGHLYFTLKDESSQLKCVMWRSAAERIRFEPQEGDAVVLKGYISVYEASGVYQMYANRMRPAGRGDLTLAFEALKEKLLAEGLFDEERKKSLPRFPQKIGIATSIDAAALRDILNVLGRRYPIVEVLIAPTLVQGAGAPAQIISALQWLDGRDDVDLILVTRGGGSIEDLWAFNDEGVARAIASARHPIICGVGHETDFTIADFVADYRAPTPSAAAEVATPDSQEIAAFINGAAQYMEREIQKRLIASAERVENLARTLTLAGPQYRIAAYEQTLSQLVQGLDYEMERLLGSAQNRLDLLGTRLQAASPLSILERGYAIVQTPDGRTVRGVADVAVDDLLHIDVIDGRIAAKVSEKSDG